MPSTGQLPKLITWFGNRHQSRHTHTIHGIVPRQPYFEEVHRQEVWNKGRMGRTNRFPASRFCRIPFDVFMRLSLVVRHYSFHWEHTFLGTIFIHDADGTRPSTSYLN